MSAFRNFLSQTKTALYRRPKEELARMSRWGPKAYFRLDAWKREMEEGAWNLKPVEATSSEPPLEIWFLTGKGFWYQSAFCAWTLAHQSGRKISVSLVDDGTLSNKHEEGIRRLFPEGATVRKEEIADKVESLLPIDKFPVLRQRWIDYVNIRKLTDIHLGSEGTKLVLDSDMLFFAEPTEMLEWWDQKDSNELCLMTDCEESYGYSRPLMEKLTGATIPKLLNVGVCGSSSDSMDWEKLEHWSASLLEAEGTSYYLEQALVAMMASTQSHRVMPVESYITFPDRDTVLNKGGILQHYVSDSKPSYFGDAWKLATS